MKFFLVILLTVGLWSFDNTDINTLRDNGVRISFSSNENDLEIIPKGITVSKFIKAKQLDFNGMNLSNNLPDFLEKMNNLLSLDLSFVDITLEELKKIKNLKKLSILNLNNNSNLFKSKGSLVAILSKIDLTELYLQATEGDESDYNAIGTSFSSLTKLDLSFNHIKNLKNLYLDSANLEFLSLQRNQLGSSFSSEYLPKRVLKYLDLSYNKITKFNYTGDFPSLISLNLLNNPFVKLDKKYKSEMVLRKGLVWTSPPKKICEKYGEEFHGVTKTCSIMQVYDAKNACDEVGGKLPTIEQFKNLINACGMRMLETPNQNSLIEKREITTSFEKCIDKGISWNRYLAIEEGSFGLEEGFFVAKDIGVYGEMNKDVKKKIKSINVGCILN